MRSKRWNKGWYYTVFAGRQHYWQNGRTLCGRFIQAMTHRLSAKDVGPMAKCKACLLCLERRRRRTRNR